MSGPASLLGYWYASGPDDKPFRAHDPDWNIHRIVEDTPGLPDVLVENAGGQRFLLARKIATAIALPPFRPRKDDPMKIELKSIQYAAFSSEETNCYTANLYVDGRKIGTVGNDGHGGCDHFHGDQAAFATADAWCKANLPKWSGHDGTPRDTDLEFHCGKLVDDWIVTRDLKAKFRSKVVMRDPADGCFYTMKHRGRIDETIAAIAKRHPGATILNTLPFGEALTLYRAATSP